MKAVLLSIKPKYCELIANGKKTLEIRKLKPKFKPPFKCFIYCTKPRFPHEDYITIELSTGEILDCFYGGGKVIGEFVCDGIIDLHDNGNEFVNPFDGEITELLMPFSCLDYQELHEYANGKILYGWHISDLKIYDAPKELSEFRKPGGKHYEHLKRPPQSWCYVEE